MNNATTRGHPLNTRNKADGLDLLAGVADKTIAAAFFDPQYRGVLDRLNYGNEGKNRAQGRCRLTQMDEKTIIQFIREIDRSLKDSGHLFLWLDKFHLCEGVKPWIDGTDLQLVDMIVWNKGQIGMGYRSRRTSEYLIVLQKTPIRAKACWHDHSIPDVWTEKNKKSHPHSKPVELQKRLISAVTQEGDIVLDPAAGGYSVLTACEELGRDCLTCDIEFGDEQAIA